MRTPFLVLCAGLLAGLLATGTASANSATASGLEFSPQELETSRLRSHEIAETAASCVNRVYAEHLDFYKKRGYSKFYGDRHPRHKTEEGRRGVLLSIIPDLRKRVERGDPSAAAELTRRVRELESISCVDLAMRCLGEGFRTVGMGDTWTKIYTWLGRIGPDGAPLFYGTDLQKALVDLGWKALFWNPDLSQNDAWDKAEAIVNPLEAGKVWNPRWGGHVYRWALVRRDRNYYGIPVHDIQTLVNFGVNPPVEFRSAPFFLGTAHSGYHVFPGTRGRVVEAHSMRELKSKQNLEMGEFNPLDQPLNGRPDGKGAPVWTRIEQYRSGVIVVPPGYISEKPWATPAPAVGAPIHAPTGFDRGRPPQRDSDRLNEFWGLPRNLNPFGW